MDNAKMIYINYKTERAFVLENMNCVYYSMWNIVDVDVTYLFRYNGIDTPTYVDSKWEWEEYMDGYEVLVLAVHV